MRAPFLLLAGIAALAACKGDPVPIAAVAAASVREPAPDAGDAKGAVEIDPALLTEGRVRVVPVERRRLDRDVALPGDVVPAEDGEADVGALVAGRIATIEVAEGERVEKGRVLARIDAPDAGRATADLLLARTRAAVAQRKLDRQRSLEKQGATSQNALDEALGEAQAARAELGAARTRVSTLGALEPASGAESSGDPIALRVPVRAPIAGVVVKRHAVLGGPVSLDRPLFHLVAPDRLLLRARLPETWGAPLAEGARATIRPRAAGRAAIAECEATVTGSFGIVDEATRAIPVRLRPAGACAWLMPGAYVDVAIRGAAPEAGDGAAVLVVPAAAVTSVRGVPTVFVAQQKPGAFRARAVRPGLTAGPWMAIEAGIAEGEQVAGEGAVLLEGELLRGSLEGG